MRGKITKRGKSSRAKKPRGRPGGKPKPSERVHLGFRVSSHLRRRLERAAKESTRSLSQEVELRLEESLCQVPLEKVLGLAQALFQQALDINRAAAEKRGEKLTAPSQHGRLLLDQDFLDAWTRDIERAKEARERAKEEE
jgi:hypothetical protein